MPGVVSREMESYDWTGCRHQSCRGSTYVLPRSLNCPRLRYSTRYNDNDQTDITDTSRPKTTTQEPTIVISALRGTSAEKQRPHIDSWRSMAGPADRRPPRLGLT